MKLHAILSAVLALGLITCFTSRVEAGFAAPTSVIALPTLQGSGNELDVSVDAVNNRLFVAAGSDTSMPSSVNILSNTGQLMSSLDWNTITGQESFPLRLQYLSNTNQLLVLSDDQTGPSAFVARLYELSLTSGGAHVDKILNLPSSTEGLTATPQGVWLFGGSADPNLTRISLSTGAVLQSIPVKGLGNVQGPGDIAAASNGFILQAGSGSPSLLLHINQNGVLTSQATIGQALGLDSNPNTNTIYAIVNGQVDVYQGLTFTSRSVPLPAGLWPALGMLGVMGFVAMRNGRRA